MKPKAPHANCSECPLKEQPFVGGDGPDKAKVVLCGEAPGKQEVERKTPFIGKSGQLMNKVLAYHDIKREDVYVTNAVLCRPPVKNGKNTPPNVQAIRACRDRLISEIQSRDPELIIAAGGIAGKSLLDTKDGITKLRIGGPKRSQELSAKIVPTFHPAAALRNPDHFPSIINDIAKIARIEVGWEPTKYKVVDDPDLAKKILVRQWESSRDIFIDVETDHEKGTRNDPEWLCIGISHAPGAAIVYTKKVVESKKFQNHLARLLVSRAHSFGYQLGKFDIQCLWDFAEAARVDEDTLLSHYATDERKGEHSLEQLATEFLGAPNYKTEERRYLPYEGASLSHLPLPILYRYNATDVDVTHRLKPILRKEMDNDGVTEMYYKLLIPGQNALARLEYRGTRLDRDYLSKLERRYSELRDERETRLREIADINPRSPQQVMKAFADLGIEIASTDQRDASFMAIKHPLKDALVAYREADKVLGTYVLGLGKRMGPDGRIHTNFNLHIAETGRTSSSDPNLQNQPKAGQHLGGDLRDAFVASEGHVLLATDYKAIEYRLAAVFAGAEWLLEQFRSGRNFHKETARSLFGNEYTEKQYTHAKNVNFGILYEQGYRSLAVQLGIRKMEAKKMIDDWYKQSPEIKAYQNDIKEQIKKNGYLTSYYGRKRRFWLITRDNWHEVSKEGLNFDIQGTASDVNLLSLIKLEPILRDTAPPIITVHDNLTFDVPKDIIHDVAKTVRNTMEDTDFSEIVPTPVGMEIGPGWGLSLQDYEPPR